MTTDQPDCLGKTNSNRDPSHLVSPIVLQNEMINNDISENASSSISQQHWAPPEVQLVLNQGDRQSFPSYFICSITQQPSS
jgi:hypothetical protein